MDIVNIIANGTIEELNDFISKHSPNAEELCTALSVAVKQGKIPMITLLIGSGAPINMKPPKKEPPLICAIENSDPDLVKLLCEHGADVNMRLFGTFTPLHVAVDIEADCARQMDTTPSTDTIRILLKYGADPSLCNTFGTPYDMALRYGFSEACELLKPQQ